MPICKNCGVEISESQYDNFKGMCSDCIRLDRTIDRKKAKNDAGINFGVALITSLVTIVFLVVAIGDPFFGSWSFVIIIPLIIALVNWYFFYVNMKKSKL